MGRLDQPGLYRLILEEIHEALTERGVNPSWLEGLDSAHPMTYRAFERALRRLTRGGWKPILILDEFDLMAQNLHLDPDFFSGLRAVAARYPIAYVTASKRPLLELTYANASALSSPFFNFFASIRLGLFPEDESRDMLARLAARAQMMFEPSTINFCLDLAGPHPFFLQIAGFHAFELQEARGGPLAAGDHARLRRRFDVSVEEHYGYFWRNLSATQQRVMATLPTSQDRHRDIMRQLEGECLIRRRAEGYDYLSSSLRAFAQSQPVPGLLQAGPIAIDESQRQTLLHGQPLSLSPTQYSLLQHFVEKRGQVIAAEDLERAV
jgi:hypothetical protein